MQVETHLHSSLGSGSSKKNRVLFPSSVVKTLKDTRQLKVTAFTFLFISSPNCGNSDMLWKIKKAELFEFFKPWESIFFTIYDSLCLIDWLWVICHNFIINIKVLSVWALVNVSAKIYGSSNFLTASVSWHGRNEENISN